MNKKIIFLISILSILIITFTAIGITTTIAQPPQLPNVGTDTQQIIVLDYRFNDYNQITRSSTLAFEFVPKEGFIEVLDINDDGFSVYINLLGDQGQRGLYVDLNEVNVGSMVNEGYPFGYAIGVSDATLITPGINTIRLSSMFEYNIPGIRGIEVFVEYSYSTR